MKNLLVFTLLFSFIYFALSGAASCQGATAGVSVLAFVNDPVCRNKQICAVTCGPNYKATCSQTPAPYRIEIPPTYGLLQQYETACVTNTIAMEELEKNLKNTAYELKNTLNMLTNTFLGLFFFTPSERSIINNYLQKFFPLLENQEVITFWKDQKRICDQQNYQYPISDLMNLFYTNIWKDSSVVDGIKAYNETTPILVRKNLMQFALHKYQQNVPLLANWTPQFGLQTLVVEALAYLANTKFSCNCDDVLKLMQTGVAPDQTSFQSLIVPQVLLDKYLTFVGQACETEYPTTCKATATATLEYELEADEEELNGTW